MAGKAQFRHLFTAHLLLRSLVQLVTIEAADVVQRVDACIPVGEDRSGNSGMAFEADQRLCLGREILDIKERARVALHFPGIVGGDIIRNPGDGKATCTVTRFAVYQRETVFRLDLFPMHAVPEVIGNPVMAVTSCDTVIGADVLGVKAADDHPFVLPDRQDCRALPQSGTGRTSKHRQKQN